MSWSVLLIGKPEDVAVALDAEGEKMHGQSQIEFEGAKPHLQALCRENFANRGGYVAPILRFEASGHGTVIDGEQVSRCCNVSIQPLYGKLV